MSHINNLIENSYKIIEIEGCNDQKTFYFEIGHKNILPGQFYLLNYNLSQKPFSVSHYNGNIIGFTILRRGEMTGKLIDNAKIGDYVGLTGPLGNHFEMDKYDNFLLIGGGVGAAPIFLLSEYLSSIGKKAFVLFGSKTSSLCDFTKSVKSKKNLEITYYTDDDSSENKGFVTNGIDKIIKDNNIDTACVCGPEKMMIACANKILNHKNIPIQMSMERYMKCGIGICGSCVLDDIGVRICADGPVFDYNLLKKSREFGNYHRDSGGVIEK